MLKGAIHLHSTYSDGEFTLREVREQLLADGCGFACMTDHAEAFDAEKLAAYVRECAELSDERFRFIAGLEYECERRMHVLGYGVTKLVKTLDPQAVISHIEEQGGVAVIAHPMDQMFEWIEGFKVLPRGIEAWNSKYDGRYAPRTQTFALVARLQERRPELRAFYGMDLHWKKQYRGLFMELETHSAQREEVLSAFARGAFTGSKDTWRLPSDGRLTEAMIDEFTRVHARSDRFRQAVKRVKKVVKSCGVNVPAPLKAQLRRIF